MDSDLGSMFLYCQWIDCGNLRQYTIQYTFLALPLCQYVVVCVLSYGSSTVFMHLSLLNKHIVPAWPIPMVAV